MENPIKNINISGIVKPADVMLEKRRRKMPAKKEDIGNCSCVIARHSRIRCIN